jgi:hypothetical protein
MVQRDAICVANAGDSRAVRESRRGIGDRWVLFSITLLEVQDMIDYIYIRQLYIYMDCMVMDIFIYIYIHDSIYIVRMYIWNQYIYIHYI